MELTQPSGEDAGAPYFFLSYAHMPPGRADEPDPDLWVYRLFRDLCDHIHNLTAHPGAPGFMDRTIGPGQIWNHELADSLGGCRVFVPLYSPRYFISPWCGKEWAAFLDRSASHRDPEARSTPSAIVPALWAPVPDRGLPHCVREVQYTHPELGERYRTYGLYGLAKLQSFRRDYQKAVLHLARRIVEVGESIVVERGAPDSLNGARDAFAEAAAAPTRRRLRISVAAGTLDQLPDGRDAQYYGPTSMHWNPYHPVAEAPVAQVAADIAAGLDFRADVGEFDHTAPPADAPEVLLLDRWLLRDPEHRTRLAEFDDSDARPVGLVVPWNDDDPDGDEIEHELAAELNATLPRRTRQGREACRTAVRGVPDERSFREVLPRVVRWAEGHYLRRARPPLPPGRPTPRFRLGGSDAWSPAPHPGDEKESPDDSE
ncbi:TIR-like protein FxsC [Streptomyces sp. NPDC090106]|uniref:TIR-like protein FxsC n=1 Tax=Streptomyces sp. NPDC090106 TaxID=3365946 RepID=UPI003820FBE7